MKFKVSYICFILDIYARKIKHANITTNNGKLFQQFKLNQ